MDTTYKYFQVGVSIAGKDFQVSFGVVAFSEEIALVQAKIVAQGTFTRHKDGHFGVLESVPLGNLEARILNRFPIHSIVRTYS